MKDFKMAQPQTIDQVIVFLSKKKENDYLMAGGTDLLNMMKSEIVEPEVVVDLKSIPGLSYIKKERDGVRIGAMTTVAELAENLMIKKDYLGLREAALSLATPQLRNVGTVGGNLCQRPRCWYFRDPQVRCRKKGGSRCFAFKGKNKYHAILGGRLCYMVHPSDLAPALISLGATISILSSREEKTIPLEEFFILPQVNVNQENILEEDEVLREIKIPLSRKEEKSTYWKFKERGTWDFALVSAAVKGALFGGTFKDIRIVLGGVAPIPWRMKKAETMIRGKEVTEDLIRKAVKKSLEDAHPLEENGYKRELAEVILSRAVLSLV